MSKIARICLGAGLVCLIVAGLARIALATMHPALYAPLAIGGILIVATFVVDFKFFYEFFSLKTTKHGLNMGWLIVMAIVSVCVVNFLAVRYEKKWDVTKEGLNTLSDQSTKILANLKAPVNFILLYSKTPQAENEKKAVTDIVKLYREKNSKVSFESYAGTSRPDLAMKYEFKSGDVGLYAEYQDKHLKVDTLSEEGITKVLLKLTRDDANRKTIYFTTGHGERDIETQKGDGLSAFKTDLETTYYVKSLKLLDGEIPADAAVLAIVGPTQMFLPAEIEKIKKYAVAGGHFFIAADPGEKHNVAQIDKLFGVDFHGDFILDPRASIPQVGPVIAVGSDLSRTSDITKSIAYQLYLLASSLGKSKDAPQDFKIEDLVRTADVSQTVEKIEKGEKVISKGPHSVVMQSTGHFDSSAKEFTAIIAGDSDFVTNQFYATYGDRDLALNAFSFLAKDTDLISIHPKMPAATKVDVVSNYKRYLAVVMFLFPLCLLFSSGLIWWKRKAA